MARSAVTTWADSFGMWHAEVLVFSDKVSKSAIRARARRAILSEINARESATLNHMALKEESVRADEHNPNMILSVSYCEAF